MTAVVWAATAVTTVMCGLVLTIRAGWDRGPFLALYVGLSPVLVAPTGIVVAVLAAAKGIWWLAAPTALLVAEGLWLIHRAAPRTTFVPDLPGPGLRVVTANVFYRNADAAASWPDLLAAEPDVVLLQEVSSISGEWLPPPGWHCVALPREDAFGTAILTREPVREWQVVELGGLPQLRAVVGLGGPDGPDVVLYCVHPSAPATRRADHVWRQQFEQLAQRIEAEPAGTMVVVGGDFNASLLHRPFARLLRRTGLVDARPSRRLALTWPSGGAGSPRGLPRVMALDHVLVRDTTVRTVKLLPPSTGDHLPIAVEIGLPMLDLTACRA